MSIDFIDDMQTWVQVTLGAIRQAITWANDDPDPRFWWGLF